LRSRVTVLNGGCNCIVLNSPSVRPDLSDAGL
jgi:hypothetical protein